MHSSPRNGTRLRRRPELFNCLIIASLLVCVVLFSSVVSLPPEHLDTTPSAHMFQNQMTTRQHQHHHVAVKEIFSIRSVLNGKYIWCGDADKILASTDDSVCLSERSFEVVVVDEANEWVAFRLLSMDTNKKHRYMQIGPPPTLRLQLAPKDTSLEEHSIHFRIETVHGFASHSRAGRCQLIYFKVCTVIS